MPSIDALTTAVIEHIERRRDALVTTLREMIRVPSVNPAFDTNAPGEAAMADDVAARYRALGIETARYEAAPGRPSIVAHVEGAAAGAAAGAAPHLLVNAHLDTVQADVGEWYDPFEGKRAGPWTTDPFGGERREGRIYGRGAADHKSPIAALLFALEAIQASGVRLAGDLTCIHDADEETGGDLGIHHLATVVPFDFDMVLYACSSEFTPLGRTFFSAMGSDNVIRAFAGWHTYRVSVVGQNLHNLTPRRAYGAIEAALPLLDRLRALAARVNGETVPLEGTGQPAMRIAGIDTSGRRSFHHQGREASIVLTRRIPAGTDPDAAIAELRAIIDEHNAACPDNPAAFELVRSIAPHETPADHRLVDAFVRSVRRVTGREATVTGLPAPVGINALLAHTPLPTVLFGYGYLNMHHAPDEHIEEAALVAMAQTYAVALIEVLGVVEP